MLARFAETAHKTQLAPVDFIHFCELSIYIHEHALNITGPEIRALLLSCGFSAEVAFRLAIQYERYRDLLGATIDAASRPPVPKAKAPAP